MQSVPCTIGIGEITIGYAGNWGKVLGGDQIEGWKDK